MTVRFNTASGRHCCNTRCQKLLSIHLLLVSIPQAVGTVATLQNQCPLVINLHVVSIPQAVGTVATLAPIPLLCCLTLFVSIPQAVGTVATLFFYMEVFTMLNSFNTASGRHCCNFL